MSETERVVQDWEQRDAALEALDEEFGGRHVNRIVKLEKMLWWLIGREIDRELAQRSGQ